MAVHVVCQPNQSANHGGHGVEDSGQGDDTRQGWKAIRPYYQKSISCFNSMIVIYFLFLQNK